MALDTRRERQSTAQILSEINRTGKVPEGFSILTGFRRKEKDPDGFAHSPIYRTGDGMPDVTPWENDEAVYGIRVYHVNPSANYRKPQTVTDPDTGVIYPNYGNRRYADRIIEGKDLDGKTVRLGVPLVEGILFGLLGPDGSQETAVIKEPQEVYQTFFRHVVGMMMGERLREAVRVPDGMIPSPVSCLDDGFWSEEAKTLSSRTISIGAASMAMTGREPGRPRIRTFSGELPDGTVVDGWTAEMLMQKMTTYVFGPFSAVCQAPEGRLAGCDFCMTIPAFSEKQARLIFEKRLMEHGMVTYNGKPMYGKDAIVAMGFLPVVWDDFRGEESRFVRIPPVDSIPCTGTSRTKVTDFFQKGVFPLRRWWRSWKETPLYNGLWTSDDLGYAFSIIFAPELGLSLSPYQQPDLPFVLLPRYV